MGHKGIVAVVLTLLGLLVPSVKADQESPLLITRLSSHTRLLVVSPHPDDGTLGAGGLIQRVLRLGGAVQVVFMTSGDGFPQGVALARHLQHPGAQDYRAYGMLRQAEAQRALATLGVRAKDVLFLGFPDGGLCPLRGTYHANNGQNYQSPFTLEDRPLITNVMLPNAGYNGTDLTKALTRVLRHFRPTLVVTVHPRDRHPDHCATYHFVSEALQALQKYDVAPRPSLLTFLIHWGSWWPMFGRDSTASQLHLPQDFPEPEGTWLSLALSPEEMQTKRQALVQYQSQMLVMGQYLLSFVRTNELFAVESPAMQNGSQPIPCCSKES
jgi:LmbE family N-acetylglucosaminyl deacetylase